MTTMNEPSTHANLPLRKKTFFALLILVPVLVLAEVAMRLLGYGLPASDDWQASLGPTPFAYFSVCDQHLGFRNRPNGKYRATRIQGNPVSTTDESGFRNGVGWTAEGDSPIVLFVVGLERVEASRASVIGTAEPAVTVLLGATLLGEPVTPALVVGGGLVLGAVLLVQREGRPTGMVVH